MTKGRFRFVRSYVATVGFVAMLSLSTRAQADSESQKPSGNLSLVMVIEGLRPEFFTPSLMPNLHRLSRRGVTFNAHHAVFPTGTGVNAASIITGAYPSTHGVLGDNVLLPEIDASASFDMRKIETLESIQGATEGMLMTVPSLGRILGAHGKELMVAGSGAPGATFLLNLDGGQSVSTLDAYLDEGLERNKPAVAMIWFAEIGQIFVHGQGEMQIESAVREVDDRIGRVLQRYKKLGLKVNVFVTSTVGFSAHPEGRDLSQFLVDEGLKADEQSRVVVVLDNASIYVEDHDRSRIREIVQRLQREYWVGAMYTQQSRPTHPESFVRGALSFQAVYMDHRRAPDILVEPAGLDYRSDLGAILVAAGPAFKRGIESGVPSAHIDLAPTLCFLHGIEPPASMDGRVLHEGLRGGPKPDTIKVLRRRHGSEATWEGGRYRLMMTELTVDGVDYLDFTRVERK